MARLPPGGRLASAAAPVGRGRKGLGRVAAKYRPARWFRTTCPSQFLSWKPPTGRLGARPVARPSVPSDELPEGCSGGPACPEHVERVGRRARHRRAATSAGHVSWGGGRVGCPASLGVAALPQQIQATGNRCQSPIYASMRCGWRRGRRCSRGGWWPRGRSGRRRSCRRRRPRRRRGREGAVP